MSGSLLNAHLRTGITLCSHLPSHFDAVFLSPAFAQRHHEVRGQAHLLKLPLSVLLDILVVVASRDEETLSLVDGLGLQIREAGAPVALQVDDMVVDELLDEGNPPRSCRTASLWRLAGRQITKEGIQFCPALRLPQVSKI